MSPNLESPVLTQMAVRVLNGTLRSSEYHGNKNVEGMPVGRHCAFVQTDTGNEYRGNKSMDGKPTGRRRVFVQTDTGNVLSIVLDRGDNAHTVKRRLQLVLNVPTDDSSLTFGDLVLKNDLTAVRNDYTILLSRNLMHRSSSTPSLCPTGKDQQGDRSAPIEVLGCSSHCFRMKQLIKDVAKGIKSGVDPIPVRNGLGGAYYFRNSHGDNIAIIKPTDEEPFAPNNPKGFVGKALGQPGLKRSVRVGETGFREVAAYLLDHGHFANVPPTVLIKITHSVFNINNGVSGYKSHDGKHISKIASFQQFIPHDFDASDHGTSSFPVAAVHKIGILDIRIFNTDRHAGNLLVRKSSGNGGFGQVELIPIDHGLCLPECLEDPYFEWIHWPQASIPFSDEELDYIACLDPIRDAEMLRMELPIIRESCLRVLILCTVFLKEAAAYGLCLAEIGEMMSREFRQREEEPSELEVLCIEAMRLVVERDILISPRAAADGAEAEEFQFDLDCNEEDAEGSFAESVPSYSLGLKLVGNGKSPLSKLEESIDEGLEQSEGEEESASAVSGGFHHDKVPTISKISMSLSGIDISDKCHRYAGPLSKGKLGRLRFAGGTTASRNSANEQMSACASFVKLVDMTEEEWVPFLEKFQALLHGAFSSRKCGSRPGAWQRQRLGTSCQF